MWEHGISERLFSEGIVLDTGGLFSGGMVLGNLLLSVICPVMKDELWVRDTSIGVSIWVLVCLV